MSTRVWGLLRGPKHQVLQVRCCRPTGALDRKFLLAPVQFQKWLTGMENMFSDWVVHRVVVMKLSDVGTCLT